MAIHINLWLIAGTCLGWCGGDSTHQPQASKATLADAPTWLSGRETSVSTDPNDYIPQGFIPRPDIGNGQFDSQSHRPKKSDSTDY